MDFKQIQILIKEFEKSSMTVLEIEKEGFKIKLSKNREEKAEKHIEKETVEFKGKEVEEKVKGYEVKSPLVGTFYASNTPSGEPFVTIGKRVEVGDTLCIIEAMKIMNEITAPVAGVIESINLANAAYVGYDQLIMVIG